MLSTSRSVPWLASSEPRFRIAAITLEENKIVASSCATKSRTNQIRRGAPGPARSFESELVLLVLEGCHSGPTSRVVLATPMPFARFVAKTHQQHVVCTIYQHNAIVVELMLHTPSSPYRFENNS